MAKTVQVAIDCADPAALSRFWAEVLGYVLNPPPEGHDSWESWLSAMGVPESEWNSASALIDPEGAGPRIYFQRVPEGKAGKNRLHLDVRVGGGRAGIGPEADRLVALGASVVGEKEERGELWVVMQDPEGNEFCLT
jgi:catechol 2,3-dioxygenase-like lactoylglutathione lyase family enzyme